MTADDGAQRAPQRRRHAPRGRARQRAGGRRSCTTPPRSPPPALYKGLFREDMFDEGQKLPTPYHRTKFESEKIAREESQVPWRVYRPAIVVGHSQTGEMDKIDGPYYFFKALQKIRGWLPRVGAARSAPSWATRTSSPSTTSPGRWTTSPTPGLDGQAFHLAHPKGQRSGDVLNTFARAGHAPHMAMRIDKRLTRRAAQGRAVDDDEAAGAARRARHAAGRLRHPAGGRRARRLHLRSSTRATPSARWPAPGIAVPELDTYADKLWDYWERDLDPDLYKDRSFEHAVNGRTVVITGASSGIGKAAAHEDRPAGGIPMLVARSMDKLEEAKAEIERGGRHGLRLQRRPLRRWTRSTSSSSSCWPSTRRSTCWSTTPGARSGARSRSATTASTTSSAPMQLNYFGTIKLTMGLLPHMRERQLRPHRQRVLDRRADQPAALQRLRGVQGGAGRVDARGVAPRSSATASRSRRSTCRSCARR